MAGTYRRRSRTQATGEHRGPHSPKDGRSIDPDVNEAIKRLVGEAARADELIIDLADGQVDVHAIGVALTEGQAAVDAMADLCKHSAKNS